MDHFFYFSQQCGLTLSKEDDTYVVGVITIPFDKCRNQGAKGRLVLESRH